MTGMTTHITDNPKLCYQQESNNIGLIVSDEIIVSIEIVSCTKVKEWYELRLKTEYKKLLLKDK